MTRGFINVYKEAGYTSQDAVSILRRKLGTKKAGHMGTLDPMAVGVLPIAVEGATKVMDYLDMDIKEYHCLSLIGAKSDTLDIWGHVEVFESLQGREKNVKEEQYLYMLQQRLDKVARDFEGIITQFPPIYSALKVDGKRLYEYARAGQDVKIKSRKTYIERIWNVKVLTFSEVMEEFGEMLEHEAKAILIAKFKESTFFTFKCTCSKGTYIRTLASDIGSALGISSTMVFLERFSSGIFNKGDAISIEDIKAMEREQIISSLVPIYAPLKDLGEVVIEAKDRKKYLNGGKISRKDFLSLKENRIERKKFPLPLSERILNGYRVFVSTTEIESQISSKEREFLGIGELTEYMSLKPKKLML